MLISDLNENWRKNEPRKTIPKKFFPRKIPSLLKKGITGWNLFPVYLFALNWELLYLFGQEKSTTMAEN
jgi:hypothetical protein